MVADKKLLLMAICVLSQWTLEQILGTYRLSDAEGVKYLAQLDRIGIIELRPLNRYRLKLAKTFRWRAHGPVMHYFRDHALLDYFSGGFDGPGEGVLMVHGAIGRSLAPAFQERLQRVAHDFAQQHLADQRLPERDREGYTVLLAMRRWGVRGLHRDAALKARSSQRLAVHVHHPPDEPRRGCGQLLARKPQRVLRGQPPCAAVAHHPPHQAGALVVHHEHLPVGRRGIAGIHRHHVPGMQ